MRIWIVFLAVIGSLFISPQPVEATAKIVMIQAKVGNQIGNLKTGSRFIDKYTGTRFVYGYCRPEYRCIKVLVDKKRLKGTGYASWVGREREVVTIKVHPGGSNAYMSRLWAHEVAHAMFVDHSKYRSNIMYPTLHKKNGDLVPFRVTDPQKKVLRKH